MKSIIETTENIEGAGDPQTDGGQLSYRQLIWCRFRKNRMGVIAGAILILFYALAIGADFFAPYHYNKINMRLRHVPPATPPFFTLLWILCPRLEICSQSRES